MAGRSLRSRVAGRSSEYSVFAAWESRRQPWLCSEEWEEVSSLLYSSDPVQVDLGVGRVSAWRARGQVPMMVELTADLCQCRLQERERAGGVANFHPLLLQYSVAITRFVNGLGDISKLRLNMCADLTTCVHEYGLPSWLVTLRHMGTHEKLPSIGAIRSGAEFCLSWLRANYWRPQRLSMKQAVSDRKSRSATPTSEGVASSVTGSERATKKEEHMLSLTYGLCSSWKQLEHTLEHASYMELADYMKKKQLLQFPSHVKCSLRVTEDSDLVTLPVLDVRERDMWVWRKHLLSAAKTSISLKQRLLSALVIATHQTQSQPSLQDFLCGWLHFLLKAQPEMRMKNSAGVEVIQIVEEEDMFLPGEIHWQQLLHMLIQHPGYYSYPLVKLVSENVKSAFSEAALHDLLHMSSLVTLSSCIGHTSCMFNRTHHEGKHSLQAEEFMASINQTRTTEHAQNDGRDFVDGTGGGEECGVRWRIVEDVEEWLQCPLGVCPGQQVGPHMLSVTPHSRHQIQMEVDSDVVDEEEVEEVRVHVEDHDQSEKSDDSPPWLCLSQQQLLHIQQQLVQLL